MYLDSRVIVRCCALFEFLFLHKCVYRYDDVTGSNFNGGQFGCVIRYKDTSNQVVISEFGGELAFENAEQKDLCYQEVSSNLYDSSKINNLLDVCKMELRSLNIKSNEHTDFSNLSTVERYTENITELTWEIDNKYTANKLADIFKHIKVLNIVVVNSNYSSEFRFDLLNSTFFGDMKKLQQLKLYCNNLRTKVELPIEFFQGLTSLSELIIEGCEISNLSAAHFQDLTNLRVLSLNLATFNNFDFLRCETLAKHVNVVDLISTKSVVRKNYNIEYFYFNDYNNYTVFQNYTNLQRLTVSGNILPFNDQYKKIFGTLCNVTDCELYFDQYGTECPHGCRCNSKHSKMGLIIECNNSEAVMELKELPKLYSETASLLLTSLNLTKLPNTTIGGYSSVETLNVADNQLDDIHISQLPESITYLDIRNNSLKDLRPEVLDFLASRNGIYREMDISGNPWTCDCYGDFLTFLDSNQNMIHDIDYVQCDGVTVSQKQDTCRMRRNYMIIGVAILLIAVGAIVCWYRIYEIPQRKVREQKRNTRPKEEDLLKVEK